MALPTSLKERAYEELLSCLLRGEFVPGDLLNRRGMATRLGMSPAPVHEAMIQLERDGFLEALPRLGTRVRTVSRADVYGHLVVREAFECQAARMICGRRVTAAYARLLPLAEALDAPDPSDAHRARGEVSFHVALVELADCPTLLREYRRIMQIGLFYRINLLMNMPSRLPVNRHRTLLEMLVRRSPTEADACVREHIWSGKPDMVRGACSRPDSQPPLSRVLDRPDQPPA